MRPAFSIIVILALALGGIWLWTEGDISRVTRILQSEPEAQPEIVVEPAPTNAAEPATMPATGAATQ